MAGKIQSPRATLIPFISAEEAATMAYPPDALPGARDVETFYGSMRVYEWGPADGEKVLFVHGDATPSLVFSKIAQGLVDAGYRVMLFDLWGRGYSDTPLHCRHDVRLFASQILFALTSSPLSWTGNGTNFSIIAFSLGGPISLAFAGAYPSAIRSLVLLGPAGLLLREILGVAPCGPALDIQLDQRRVTPVKTSPSRVEKSFDMEGFLQWQFDHHQGHIHSFQDTIRYGPLQTVDLWRNVCDIIAGRTRSNTALQTSKLLIFLGRDDDVVVGDDTAEDIMRLLPPAQLQIEYLPGGHGFPYPNSEKITRTIPSSWSAGPSVL
ncbi:Lipase 1 [Cytospora mali]|uniref:Lipase 1 n=1 Tax=Cytospora mali TaxID=578113 RepID=A0A194W451_CYTMA|nr:Lipase 1 [Valsa mali]